MLDEKQTNELMEILQKTNSTEGLARLIEQPTAQPEKRLQAYLMQAMQQRGLAKSEVVSRSGLQRTYAYQLLQGVRLPGRDKLVALCIGIGMDLEETQKALRIASLGSLYPKNRRDAIIVFAINRGLGCMGTNDLLFEFGEALLE